MKSRDIILCRGFLPSIISASARLCRAAEVVALDMAAASTVGVAGVAVRLAGRLGCLAATELDGAGGLFQCRRHQRQRSDVA